MSTYETFSLVLSTAGSIGVIVSLWLLSRQTGVFRSQLMESMSQSMTTYSLEISRIFLEHPQLRPYFFSGQTIEENHPDYLQAEAIAEVILDIFWTMDSQANRIRGRAFQNIKARQQWANYVGDVFATSPLLASFLNRRRSWYGDEMISYMERGLARARKAAAAQGASA